MKQAVTGPDRSELVISVRGLVERYASREAVAGIDFEVRRGEIFAFLGPNGAGKTTTVEILEGFRQRTQGQVSVLGHDPATAGGAWRDRVGVVLQESEPEPSLSVRECLAMYAGFYRAPRDIDDRSMYPPWPRRATFPDSRCGTPGITAAPGSTAQPRNTLGPRRLPSCPTLPDDWRSA